MTQVIDTPEGINAYVAITLRSALKLWVNHKIKANRAYTPANMIRTASRLTGKQFKPRDYEGAIAALTELIEGKG